MYRDKAIRRQQANTLRLSTVKALPPEGAGDKPEASAVESTIRTH
jgi:hypothetical protein